MSDWVKSSRCGESSHCIEVRTEQRITLITGEDYRDIRDRTSTPAIHIKSSDGTLWATPDEWQAFLAGAKAGDFDHITPGEPS